MKLFSFQALRLSACALIALTSSVQAQEVIETGVFEGGGYGVFAPVRDVFTPSQQRAVWDETRANIEMLSAQGKLDRAKADATVRFSWPMAIAPGRGEKNTFTISNYIDHNTSQGEIKDFDCGTRSYDLASGGHKGTDISLPQRGFYLMDSEHSQVLAAAAGVITLRRDGESDRTCGNLNTLPTNSLTANAIGLRHDDGTITYYYHMKKDTVTAKQVGERVAEGEYLGIVGSSGFSSGPHLHFEVRDAANNVVDPWVGACNPTTTVSLWKAQQKYYNPQILNIFPSARLPSNATMSPTCDTATNQAQAKGFSEYVQPEYNITQGQPFYYVILLRDYVKNDGYLFELVRPDGSIFSSFNATNTQNYFSSSYWYFTRTISTSEPTGAWKMRVTFNGATSEVGFTVAGVAPTPAQVYDFYAPSLNQYFRTANPGEAGVVARPESGFVPLADSFIALDRNASGAGISPVCRFYGDYTIGPNSHFYTADPGECNALKQIANTTPAGKSKWNYEEIAFSAVLPIGGVCPISAPYPVYRAYNGNQGQVVSGKRFDSNHQLTTLYSRHRKLIDGSKWKDEGVVMCSSGKP